MQNRWTIPITIIAFILAAGCAATNPAPESPVIPAVNPSVTVTTMVPGPFALHVANLASGDPLPDAYTCRGLSESPGVSWDNVPAGTKSLVLLVVDPDAQQGGFTHWIVYNIPPESRELKRAQPNLKDLSNGAQQGENSAGSRSYFPPCPPPGPAHRYNFLLFAVDMDIVQPAADRDSIDQALAGHTLGQAKFITTYKR